MQKLRAGTPCCTMQRWGCIPTLSVDAMHNNCELHLLLWRGRLIQTRTRRMLVTRLLKVSARTASDAQRQHLTSLETRKDDPGMICSDISSCVIDGVPLLLPTDSPLAGGESWRNPSQTVARSCSRKH